MKCAWVHCQHGGEVDKKDAVKNGTRYYHPDCLRGKIAINDIIKLYHERIDDHPIENFLRRTVNELVFKNGYDAEFLLFALRYCLDHGWNLHSPNGLYYVAKDKISKKEWDKRKEEENHTVTQVTIEGETNYDVNPIINTNKPTGFASILGR